MRNRAFASCCGAQRMGARPADVVLILGYIGEMRKEAEGANNLQRLRRLQRVQCRLEIASCRQILVPAEADGVLPNVLNGGEDGVAALLAYCIAQDPTEQPDIRAERQVLVFGLDWLAGQHAPSLSIAFLNGSCRKCASP